TNRDLAALCYAFLARYEAAVARSPQERAQVNWNQILQWISRAVTRDYFAQGDGNLWWAGYIYLGQDPTWTRADYKTIGLADRSNRYIDWLNTPLLNRTEFVMDPDDRRIGTVLNATGGAIYFTLAGSSSFRAERGTYHFSRYFHSRYRYFRTGGATGPMPFVTVREMRLLRAEALLRTGGDLNEVAAIINETRVANGGLPPASAADGRGSPSDGNAQNPARVRDQTLWAKLKREWLFENFNVTSGLAYFTRRGWGELVSGTPLHLPVPANELETLRLEVYTHGGNIGDVAPRVQANVPFTPKPLTGQVAFE
ncbi:MAG: hypothetical protein N2561_06500, partial [Bacteroidetes bacterium]|nr:hypothetical protein [Rhodothermia bacterium]MCS7155064.1 hypothetical protein [Bacteroidota bacterium]MCX7907170.1 hypothetical protein [Bacteroidota bacterium]